MYRNYKERVTKRKHHKRMTKILFVDVETTMKTKELREITVKPCINGKMKKGITILVKYNGQYGTRAEQETHNNRALTRKAAFNKLVAYLRGFIDPFNANDKFVMVAHNATFDHEVFYNFFTEMGGGNIHFGNYFYHQVLCTIQMQLLYCTLTGKMNQVNSFKLDDLCAFWSIEVDKKQRHTSKYDVEILTKLYKKIENELYKLRPGVDS